jgi:YggT family protein
MVAIIDFDFFILHALFGIATFAIIISAIISWLVAFDVINLRNRGMYQVAHLFERLTRPILAPFQRFIPTFGGIDVSPIVALIVIQGIDGILLSSLHVFLRNLAMGAGPY